jgi:hypothetical protein
LQAGKANKKATQQPDDEVQDQTKDRSRYDQQDAPSPDSKQADNTSPESHETAQSKEAEQPVGGFGARTGVEDHEQDADCYGDNRADPCRQNEEAAFRVTFSVARHILLAAPNNLRIAAAIASSCTAVPPSTPENRKPGRAADRVHVEFQRQHLEFERLHQEFERVTAERFARIETQMAEIIRVLNEHGRILESLTEGRTRKNRLQGTAVSESRWRRIHDSTES